MLAHPRRKTLARASASTQHLNTSGFGNVLTRKQLDLAIAPKTFLMADGYHHHSSRPHARDVAPDGSAQEAAQAHDGERGIDFGALAQQGIAAWNKLDPATQGKVLNSGKDVAGVCPSECAHT